VEAIFKDSRKRVVSRRTEGKVENSRGWVMYIEVRSTNREMVKLHDKRTSKSRVGRGMIMTSRMATTAPAMQTSLRSRRKLSRDKTGDWMTFSAIFVYRVRFFIRYTWARMSATT